MRRLPGQDGQMMTAEEFASRWLGGHDPIVLENRAPRPCVCDDQPVRHWAMAHLHRGRHPADLLPDLTIEYEPGDPPYDHPWAKHANT